ncbi:MAG TPA: hypothetical protein DCF63_05155 [Planctomycetaceae bacterium]|nr:hypothetical protein [Planctomycetaceae bacterium]
MVQKKPTDGLLHQQAPPDPPIDTLTTGSAGKASELPKASFPVALLCSAVSQLREGVLITVDEVDWPNPTIVFANAAICQLTGYSTGQLVGMTPELLHGNASPPETLSQIASELRAGRASLSRLIIVRSDRNPVDVELFITPLFDSHGNRSHFLCIFRDLAQEQHTDQARQISENRFLSSMEMTGLLPWSTDSQGEIVDDCPILRRYTGLRFQQTKGMGWTQSVHPDDLEKVLQPLADALQNKRRYEVEFRLRRFDGVYRTFMCRAVPTMNEDGSIREWFGVCTDFSELKHNQQRVAANLAAMVQLNQVAKLSVGDGDLSSLLQAVIDAAVVIAQSDFGTIQLLDADSGRLRVVAHRGFPDGWLNSCRVLPKGNCPACIVQRKCVYIADVHQCPNFIGTQELDMLRKVDVRSVLCTPLIGRSGEVLGIFSTHFKTPHPPDDWSLKYIDLLARQAADGIQHQMAADALRDSEERLRAVLDTACDAIVTIDQRGTIVSANPATDQLFGYCPKELVGQNISVLMPDPYRDEHDGYIQRYLETGTAHIIGMGREVTAQRKDGSTFPIDLNVSEIPHLGLFTGIIRDISERKNLQRDILAIADDERRRIGQDLHDSVQQELAAIGMIAQALLSRLATTSGNLPTDFASRCSDLTKNIQSGLSRAHQELKNISRGLVPLSLHSDGLMEALRELAIRTDGLDGISCAFKCEQPVSVADGSMATHLYRIAQEAVTNSLRHAKAQHILIELDADQRSLVLKIADDGSGIAIGTSSAGMGLKTMHYRASLIGAHLTIKPVERGGTLITCNVWKREKGDTDADKIQ